MLVFPFGRGLRSGITVTHACFPFFADGITVTHACFPFWGLRCTDYGDTCLFSLFCAAPRENSSAVPGKLSADLGPGTLQSILRQAGLKE